MKYLIAFIIVTFNFGGLLMMPIFIYGLMYLPFSASMNDSTLVAKMFVFLAGVTYGVLSVRYLKLKGDSLINKKLPVPADVQARFVSISNTVDSNSTIESTLFSVIDCPVWYDSNNKESLKPKQLALLVLFLVQLVNIERDAKKRENE